MASTASSLCHCCATLLPQPASSSRDAPVSQFSAVWAQNGPELHFFSTSVSSGYSLSSYPKNSSRVCDQLTTVPILSKCNSFSESYLRRSSWVRSICTTSASSGSCTYLPREPCYFTRSSFQFEIGRSRSSVPCLKASQGTETESEIGNTEDEGLASWEATAVVTVGAIASDTEAISKLLEVIKEQEAIGDDSATSSEAFISEELKAIYAKCQFWRWKNKYPINYMFQGSGPPVVLVHGFGASIGHWRRNIGVLSETNTVYAIDLLGLGASAKPTKFAYTMETWAELLIDFLNEIVGSSAVLVGNSIGSLACLIASAEAPAGLVRGTVLLNCAGGMNNKALTDDWRLKLALPLLWLIDFLLNRPSIAIRLFNRIRSRENIKSVLQSVYNNKAAVDDELVEVILQPADTAGALDAFVSIITGPPGPKPQTLMPKIFTPVLLIWGDDDPFTPINGPVGKYFTALSTTSPNVKLYLLPNVGHCPHDDRPDLVHEKLVPWLASLGA